MALDKKRTEEPSWLELFAVDVMNYVMYELPPGPKFLTLASVVNLQKVGMVFYLPFLMYYYDNFTDEMCLYACMHGSYGLLWFMKHLAFPDKTFLQKCTFSSALVCWIFLLGPYMIPAYLLASGKIYNEIYPRATTERRYSSLLLYIFGVCTTLAADC